MKIHDFRLTGIRCFEDTGDIACDSKCNIFVGKNNSGKTTLLKALIGFQLSPLDGHDMRPGFQTNSFVTSNFYGRLPKDQLSIGIGPGIERFRVTTLYGGNFPNYTEPNLFNINLGQPLFVSARPGHSIIPFVAKRKAASFNEAISLGSLTVLDGTFSNLYNRIDLLAGGAHPLHRVFHEAVTQIIGLPITTTQSPNGKVAGFHFDLDNFVTLDRMGDGVTEMVALIVELCIEENKIFVLEEPETNLHPSGLKALLSMVRASSEKNQFFIATHSNVVVRELSSAEFGKVFRVYRDGVTHTSPSKVEEVEKSPAAHMDLLRELGYEFADFDLHDAWLFLEESSAERIFRDILFPMFNPKLVGKLRTFSSGGVDALGPSVADFNRLMVFVHLQPVYEGRLWVRADGDEAGKKAIDKLRTKFPNIEEQALATFNQEQFENYYPSVFSEQVKTIFQIEDKKLRQDEKKKLLQDVLDWTITNPDEAKTAWGISAAEPISLLNAIEKKITNGK
jgi:predicted ATPase